MDGDSFLLRFVYGHTNLYIFKLEEEQHWVFFGGGGVTLVSAALQLLIKALVKFFFTKLGKN